jgi:hypothetical protein
VRRPPPIGQVAAAVAPDHADADVVWLDPLDPPPPMPIAAIEAPSGGAIEPITVRPAQIPALEVRPISDPPRPRRNQE